MVCEASQASVWCYIFLYHIIGGAIAYSLLYRDFQDLHIVTEIAHHQQLPSKTNCKWLVIHTQAYQTSLGNDGISPKKAHVVESVASIGKIRSSSNVSVVKIRNAI